MQPCRPPVVPSSSARSATAGEVSSRAGCGPGRPRPYGGQCRRSRTARTGTIQRRPGCRSPHGNGHQLGPRVVRDRRAGRMHRQQLGHACRLRGRRIDDLGPDVGLVDPERTRHCDDSGTDAVIRGPLRGRDRPRARHHRRRAHRRPGRQRLRQVRLLLRAAPSSPPLPTSA